MIHPGGSGCEIYRNISKGLSQSYNCFGVDSYNLYNEVKICNVHDLAIKYLEYINKMHYLNNEYHLFGWSLGGQIAIEMASILEKRGVKTIYLYLVDTILWGNDEYMQELRNNEEVLILNNNDNQRFEGELEVLYDTDRILAYQKMTCKLEYSKVILFKAMNVDYIQNNVLMEYMKKLEYNNIDKVVVSRSNMKVVKLPCHHYNILDDNRIVNCILGNNEYE